MSDKLVLKDLLMVITGGALGSSLRYLVGLAIPAQHKAVFPFHTLLVNVLGCFLVGLAVTWIQRSQNALPLQLFFITGFAGSFTTFSAFSHETLRLMAQGQYRLSMLYIFVSLFTGLTAAAGGLWLGRLPR